MREFTHRELTAWLRGPEPMEPDTDAIVVALEPRATALGRPEPDAELAALVEPLPYLIVGVTTEPLDGVGPAWCDVVVTEAELPALTATIERSPRAARALALLLRGHATRSVASGLVAESATYSMLQAGPEFAAWRATRPVRARSEVGPAVLVDRTDGDLHVRLNRPHVRNALDRRMRDELVEALTIALADPTVSRVILTGAGEAFCAGGDLDEFGSREDPASAHLIRLTRSPALLLHRLADRVEVHLHGATVGSGIEMAAFARRVVAQPSTRIALPELGLGLIPGAGGTVSLPARIGRQRTAWLALTGATIDATRARDWGLVDAIADTDANVDTNVDGGHQ